ncbi:hypothetical protein THOM_2561, partial [Trachipleistophora hominis]
VHECQGPIHVDLRSGFVSAISKANSKMWRLNDYEEEFLKGEAIRESPRWHVYTDIYG